MILNEIIEVLNNNKIISEYKLKELKKESSELFFVKKNLETVRHTNTTDYTVTIYVRHDSYIGSVNLEVFSSTSKEEFENELNLMANLAKNINDKDYETIKDINSIDEIDSNFKNYTLNELSSKIANAILKLDMDNYQSINALEIFVNKYEETIIRSNNVKRIQKYYDAMIEAIPTYTKGDSVELYEAIHFNNFDEAHLLQTLKENLSDVKLRFEAKNLDFDINPIKVAFRISDMAELFSYITSNFNYSNVYQQVSIFNIGDKLQSNPINDKLNITLKGSIKGLSNSKIFDGEGESLKDTLVVKDGVVVNNYGSKQFASYLNKESTGNLPCMEVECGKTSIKDFKEPYFECVSLSGIQVDMYNDYLGGEVRLGLLHKDGLVIPYTGISISAKLSEALNDLTLSKEVDYSSELKGPKLMLFGNISIIK